MLSCDDIVNSELNKYSYEISKNISLQLNGHDDPNFKRIHHCYHHIVLCLKEIMGDKCKNYVEIGTHFGHSLSTLLQSNFKSNYLSIDLFSNKTIAKDCKIKDIHKLALSNIEKYNKNNYNCKIIKGNSHSNNTLRLVKKYMPNGIDLLFIDGDHRYNGIFNDFINYYPLVNKGGIIIFDDYLPLTDKNGKKREATNAIDEIIKNNNNLNIIGLIKDINNINNQFKNNIEFIVQKK